MELRGQLRSQMEFGNEGTRVATVRGRNGNPERIESLSPGLERASSSYPGLTQKAEPTL